jgi:hypothetical protein
MKRSIFGALIVGCIASPVHAASITWQGDVFITAVNDAQACAAQFLNVGTFGRAVFRPRNLGTNGATDTLSIVFARNAFHVTPTTTPVAGSLHQATQARVRYINGYINGAAGFIDATGVVLSGVTVNPNSGYTANTPTFKINLTLQDIYPQPGPSGCTPTFQGTLAKRLS